MAQLREGAGCWKVCVRDQIMPEESIIELTRRQLFSAALGGLAGGVNGRAVAAGAELCRADVPIDDTQAVLFPAEAPLVPAAGLRDARAVWVHVPRRPKPRVLLFLHGYDNYVTVDAGGRPRVPDWAAADVAARSGAAAKSAAPLIYGLDRLAEQNTGQKPIVLVPEDSTLAQGAFWARVPAGQYADPARLESLVADCLAHLACLRGPQGRPYLSASFARARPERVFLCGHSGAGLILQEAAGSSLVLPETGVPTDLWLFDCTYWSQITNFVQFCARWHRERRLAAGNARASRFVCVYRPQTQTEALADVLRAEIAGVLGVPPASLLRDHAPDDAAGLQSLLATSAVLFLQTRLPHDSIPSVFIPALLKSAA